MRLPDKNTPYHESVLSLFPIILKILQKHQSISISALYQSIPDEQSSNLIGALDCLFALGKITLIRESGEIRHADRDSM